MSYKHTVDRILDLPWEDLERGHLFQLMILTAYTSSEFAESLRLALAIHPGHRGLIAMAQSKLMTNNICFKSYTQTNDHAAYLCHFLQRENLLERCDPRITEACDEYHRHVRMLSPHIRVMSIISREQEITEIFRRVLSSPLAEWKDQLYGPFDISSIVRSPSIQREASTGP